MGYLTNKKIELASGGVKNDFARPRGEPQEALELREAWVERLDLGGVHIERLIGGVKISMLLPDGTSISQELTGPEFYEIFYRWADPSDKRPGIIYAAVVAWAFVCVAVSAVL